jgi:hypothetical protein
MFCVLILAVVLACYIKVDKYNRVYNQREAEAHADTERHLKELSAFLQVRAAKETNPETAAMWKEEAAGLLNLAVYHAMQSKAFKQKGL